MTKLAASFAGMATLLGLCLAAVPAQAQLSRTFVSAAIGNDANDCNRTTPCRSFQGAHDKTSPDGEITVLDPGGYGAVTITKSIAIINDGVGEASILVSGGATGFSVNAPATAAVNLRGITVQGIGFGGGDGLRFNSGLALTITNSVFRNHTGTGILIFRSADGTSNVSIAHSLVADNGRSGIQIAHAGNTNLRIAVDGVTSVNNSRDGFAISSSAATGTVDAAVTDSVSAGNGDHGFHVTSSSPQAAVNLTLVRCVSANNQDIGIVSEGGAPAVVRVGESVISGNAASFVSAGPSNVRSFGDNYIAGNRNGDGGPITIPTK